MCVWGEHLRASDRNCVGGYKVSFRHLPKGGSWAVWRVLVRARIISRTQVNLAPQHGTRINPPSRPPSSCLGLHLLPSARLAEITRSFQFPLMSPGPLLTPDPDTMYLLQPKPLLTPRSPWRSPLSSTVWALPVTRPILCAHRLYLRWHCNTEQGCL